MIDKKKVIITVFSVVFVCGVLLVLNAWNIGEYFSRQYDETGWMTDPYEVNHKAIAYLVTGLIISLVSGFGLVSAVIKTFLK